MKNLTNKAQDRYKNPTKNSFKNKENLEFDNKKLSNPSRAERIISSSRIKDIGNIRKLVKNSSQPAFKTSNERKASYLGHLKSMKTHIKKKTYKKVSKVANPKTSARYQKPEKIRDKSLSVQVYYTERHQKFGKQKSNMQTKFNTRNPDISDSEFSTVGEGSSAYFKAFKKRTSVDVKKTNKTISNDLITPRNKKLIPKVSLLRKIPSDSNERGQSSNYRKLRANRIGVRNGNVPSRIHKTVLTRQPSLNKSNSVNRGSLQNNLAVTSKLHMTGYEDP
jgi:hypothetical protein